MLDDKPNLKCEYCKFSGLPTEDIFNNCSLCSLIYKMDDCIALVLKSIIVGNYSQYAYEIDERSSSVNYAIGYSYLQNRKHTQSLMNEINDLNFKNFYILMHTQVETLFNIINAFCKIHVIEEDKRNEYHIIEKAHKEFSTTEHKIRYKSLVLFIRSISNVLKHTSGIVTRSNSRFHASGNYLVEKHGLSYGDDLNIHYGDIKNCYSVGPRDYYSLACRIQVYFRDLISYLTSTTKYKYKSLDLLRITNELVDLKLRGCVAKVYSESSLNDGLVFFGYNHIDCMEARQIESFISTKVKLLKMLSSSTSKTVEFELFGICNLKGKKAAFLVESLNIFPNLKNRIKINKKVAGKKLMDFLQNLSLTYGEDFTVKMFTNDFRGKSNKQLSDFMLDYYSRLNKHKDLVDIVRLMGLMPFMRWNPLRLQYNPYVD